MKTGILVAVLVLIILAAAPFGFSYWAESRLNDLFAEMSDNGTLSIDVVKTDRGWFQTTSEAVFEVRGDLARKYEEYQRNAGAEVEPLRCTVRNRIHHGPIPFTHDTKPAVAAVDSALVAGSHCRSLQDRLKLSVRTWLHFDGGGVSHISTPEQSVSADGGHGLVHWHGLDADIRFSREFERVRTEVTSPGIDVSDPTADVSVRDLRWRSDIAEGLEGLDLGSFDFTVASLEVTPKTGDALKTTLREMALHGSSAEAENATIDSEVSLRAERLSAGDLEFGPARYVLALRNMDAEAMAKITAAIADARRKNLPDQQAGMLVGATLLGLLPDILKKGPVLEISELSIASPQGTAQGAARLTIDTADPAVFQNPMLLTQALVLDASFQVPEALLVALAERSIAKEVASLGAGYSDEQITAMARMRVRQGMASEQAQQWFVLDQGVYRLELKMDQGRMTLNGRAIQPGALTQ